MKSPKRWLSCPRRSKTRWRVSLSFCLYNPDCQQPASSVSLSLLALEPYVPSWPCLASQCAAPRRAFPDHIDKSYAETGGEDTSVPLPNVTAKILSKVMEYCKFHVAAKSKTEEDKPSKTDEEISAWDKDFVKVDQATLFELILVCTAHLRHMSCSCRPCGSLMLPCCCAHQAGSMYQGSWV